jgi:hypothetical protein
LAGRMARRRRTSPRRSRPSRGMGGTGTCLDLRYQPPPSYRQACIWPWHWPVFLAESTRKLDAEVPPYLRLFAGPRAASLVVVLCLADRPRLARGMVRVDTAGSGNGTVEKIGAAEWNLKRLGRHFAFNVFPLRCHPPAHPRGRQGTPLTRRGKLQRAARKLSRAEHEAYVTLPGGPVREAYGRPRCPHRCKHIAYLDRV